MKRFTLALFAMLFVIGACGEKMAEKHIESAVENATGQKVSADINGNSYEVKSADGKIKIAAGDKATLPNSFPKDVFVENGAQVIASADVPGGSSVTLRSAATKDAAFAKYKAGMLANGWKHATSMDMGGAKTGMFMKGSRVVTINADSSSGETLVSVVTAQQ